jgi:hypothetical protein
MSIGFVVLKEVYDWLLTRVEPMRASDGSPLLSIMTTLDIEGIKCAEQA